VKPLILASASSARAKLLGNAGLDFRIIPAAVDEPALKHISLAEGCDVGSTALRIAAEKARAVALIHSDAIVLGADQILSLDGEMISKCRDRGESVALLKRLRGQTHELVTAAVLSANGTRIWSHMDVCHMKMRNFSDTFLDMYVSRAGTSLVECVGCYEFEGLGAQLLERVSGDFFSVLGLPLLPVLAALREHGVIAQ
jgi:septum formation protein